MLDQAKPDGSSCTDMAASLLALLQLDGYDYVLLVHLLGKDLMTKDRFRDVIDKSWNWLDGKSLL